MNADHNHPGPATEIDTSLAHPARVYDYWLGAKDNFAADREAAERVLAITPGLRFRVRANRAFLARAVRFLAGAAGLRQFLDIRTGIPAADNTHQVAQAAAADARIVYVDNDPIVLAHARALWPAARKGPRTTCTAICASRWRPCRRAATWPSRIRPATSTQPRPRCRNAIPSGSARGDLGLGRCSPQELMSQRRRPHITIYGWSTKRGGH